MKSLFENLGRHSPSVGHLRLLALSVFLASCLSVDFDPPSVVNTVRVFAAKADKPFAKPGDTVELELLAHDGRADKTRPMRLFWIPLPCINPVRDLYYLCFAQLAGQQAQAGGGGGGGGGGGATLPLRPGTDLTELLPGGPKFSFTIPRDIIATHPPTAGAGTPYGIAIIFNIACAGRVKIEEPGNNPQSVPLGCYDDSGNKLGPDDYVIGFTRVYVYEDRTNTNPVIDEVVFDGKVVPQEGIVVDRCQKEQFRDCPQKNIGVSVPDSAWEQNERSTDSGGKALREQVWATYYGTLGRYDSEIRLLFDPSSGRVVGSENKLRIPREVGKGLLWVVVRDNRGGTTWREVPIEIR